MDGRIVRQCRIIWEVRDTALWGEQGYWFAVTGDPDWQLTWTNWIDNHDLGAHIASAVQYELVQALTDAGERAIRETWDDLCRDLGLDPRDEYESFERMLEMSVAKYT